MSLPPRGRVSQKAMADAVQGWTVIFDGCKPLKMKETKNRILRFRVVKGPWMGFYNILSRGEVRRGQCTAFDFMAGADRA